jgi:Ca2+-binding RTX toxin-like protein
VSAEVDGSFGADVVITGSGFDTLWGNAGNDSLYAGAGDDVVIGDWDDDTSTGNDWLFGGDGNDEMIGGIGNDVLYGGNGDDLFSIGNAVIGNDSFSGGAGFDVVSVRDVFGSGVTSVAFNQLFMTAPAGIEVFALDNPGIHLTGTAGNDVIDLTGVQVLTWNVEAMTTGLRLIC